MRFRLFVVRKYLPKKKKRLLGRRVLQKIFTSHPSLGPWVRTSTKGSCCVVIRTQETSVLSQLRISQINGSRNVGRN